MKPFTHNLLEQEYAILPSYLSPGSKRRSGIRMMHGVKFIVAHDTGNPGSTARGNVGYYERSRNERSASAHVFVDHTQIIECIPALTGPPEKAWHVLYNRNEDNILYGCHANDAAIGVEYCYGHNIDADEAYRRYVWVLAYACWRFGLNPGVSVIGHHLLDPGRKLDPVSGLAHSRRSYAQLLLDVVDVFHQGGGTWSSPTAMPFPAEVKARGLLNIRVGEPFRRAKVARQISSGLSFTVQGIVTGERINGIEQWYSLGDNEFCWSGATELAAGA